MKNQEKLKTLKDIEFESAEWEWEKRRERGKFDEPNILEEDLK